MSTKVEGGALGSEPKCLIAMQDRPKAHKTSDGRGDPKLSVINHSGTIDETSAGQLQETNMETPFPSSDLELQGYCKVPSSPRMGDTFDPRLEAIQEVEGVNSRTPSISWASHL